tara:strand:- start:501 stop:683 length:183 start_codon:yes stop_codon:yes gene_type:complete
VKTRALPVAQMNVRLPVDLIDGINDFCEDNKIIKKDVIELALRRFLTTENKGAAHVEHVP